MRVLLVYPWFPNTYWSFRHALSLQGKRSLIPPLGLITVSAMLPPSWEKRLVDMNVRGRTVRLCTKSREATSVVSIRTESGSDRPKRIAREETKIESWAGRYRSRF
jgi:hypothetical protein